ncbi:MAG: hypothetical protein ACJ73E_01835 [Mycobacteriales bacterium]
MTEAVTTGLSIVELESEQAELLPAREALGFFNTANIAASNTALALNAGSFASFASARATQVIIVGG